MTKEQADLLPFDCYLVNKDGTKKIKKGTLPVIYLNGHWYELGSNNNNEPIIERARPDLDDQNIEDDKASVASSASISDATE